MANYVYVPSVTTDEQRAEILALIDNHNARLFDGRDYVQPELLDGGEFACINDNPMSEDSRESIALVKLFYSIQDVLDPDPRDEL